MTIQQFTGKVLLVDDELDLLEIASIYLAEMGFEVLQASDATQALSLFEKNQDVNLLVTDIAMAGEMHGIELAKKIRQLKPNILVVYTSGFSEKLSDKKDKEEVLNKPYSRESFTAIISQIMKNK